MDKVVDTQSRIREVAKHPLCQGDERLRIVGIKMFQDGGMLTGSAYMREPWGVSRIYSISDPRYRGMLFIEKEDLREYVRTAVEMQTAVHGPFGRRRCSSQSGRCVRRDQQIDADPRHAAMHHPLQFHEPRGHRAHGQAGSRL